MLRNYRNSVILLHSCLLSFTCGFVGNSNFSKRSARGGIIDTFSQGVKHTQFFSSHEDENIVFDDNESSSTRRNFIISLLSSATCLVPTIASAAYVDDDKPFSSGVVEDNKKVVLTVSSENIPTKYDETSTSNVPSSSNSLGYCTNQAEDQRISVFERVAPSVAFIDTFAEQRDAFSTNIMEVPLGAGSGIVWDDKGHIVTNYHVIRNAKSAQVAILTKLNPDEDETKQKKKSPTPSSSVAKRKAAAAQEPVSSAASIRNANSAMTSYTRRVYKAKVIGTDPGKDLAVLKIDAPVEDLYPIEIGPSDGLHVGQTTMAIGNPFGLDHTLTVGVISGMGREVKSPIGRPISNVIQTDAAINPGNSGGPLLNGNGQMIGINTAIFSTTGASAGIGFAIPSDPVKYIVETLIRDGRVVRAILGISYLESKQARALGITKGVLVLDVPVGSPAFKAGMRGTRRTESGLIEIGDIIIKIDDSKIDSESDLFTALEMKKPGDSARVTLNRVIGGSTDKENNGRGVTLKMKEVTIVTQLKASSEVETIFSAQKQ